MTRDIRAAMHGAASAMAFVWLAALSGHTLAASEPATGRSDSIESTSACSAALTRVKPDDADKLIDVTSRCLAVPGQGIVVRSLLFRIRGEAYAMQHNTPSAIANFEDAFRLVPPKTGWQIIALASAYYGK